MYKYVYTHTHGRTLVEEILQELLAASSDTEALDERLARPLHWAARSGHATVSWFCGGSSPRGSKYPCIRDLGPKYEIDPKKPTFSEFLFNISSYKSVEK